MFDAILLPVDPSDPRSWTSALPAALRLRAPGGTIHAVTVVPRFELPLVGNFFEPDFEAKALHAAGEALTDWMRENVPEGEQVRPHILHGRIYDEILTAADRLGVDAIVIGSATSGDYPMGSNAARVVRHARCSVLLVRGPD
jgi:nucleotide-binding universal stress UspA family protein